MELGSDFAVRFREYHTWNNRFQYYAAGNELVQWVSHHMAARITDCTYKLHPDGLDTCDAVVQRAVIDAVAPLVH